MFDFSAAGTGTSMDVLLSSTETICAQVSHEQQSRAVQHAVQCGVNSWALLAHAMCALLSLSWAVIVLGIDSLIAITDFS